MTPDTGTTGTRADDIRLRAHVPAVSHEVALGNLQASQPPIIVQLGREPAGRPSLKRATTNAIPAEADKARTAEAEARPVKRQQTQEAYNDDE